MNPSVRSITQRLSLRPPQRESLEILHDVFEATELPERSHNLDAALQAIQEEHSKVEDFERAFPSLCFSLATGVGKTRLMGAFIAYMHIAHKMRNFFVLAPNLTIYEKLVSDFTPNSPKYVFKGIAEFATETPWIITGDNYEEYRGQGSLYERVEINIFNISKLNRDTRDTKKGGPRIRNLQETLGESYFDYLKGLTDLVLLMDESHRYRADAGVRALNELNPILGLELTATPFIDKASGQNWFKNIIYDYPLSRAIEDGFVKDPAVATQKDFNPNDFDAATLENIKLEDGIRLHEETRTELDTYARQTGRTRVKPFMLVIARDTTHAASLLEKLQSEKFSQGAYNGKVIQVDSTTKKQEEEVVERLLRVEDPEEPTEIVIHVNMLKEGWDVNNLYTIVPLRAANARTLIEQSIGRGLRLPYGQKTGIESVDRLTIVAHDKFREIIDEANRSDSPIRLKERIIEKPEDYKKPVQVISRPTIETRLFGDPSKKKEEQPSTTVFKTETERRVGQKALEIIRKREHLPSIEALEDPDQQATVVAELREAYMTTQLEFEETKDDIDWTRIVQETVRILKENSIQIPRITVVPTDDHTTGFSPFDLDTSKIPDTPVAQDVLLQYLSDNRRAELKGNARHWKVEDLPEDYIVNGMLDFDDIDYDENADLLYGLASQVVEYLKHKNRSDDDVDNILRYHERTICGNIHAQMGEHFWEKSAGLKPTLIKGWMALKDCPYNAEEGSESVNFRQEPASKRDIRRYVYSGFEKCLYPFQKFDSDSERRFSEILESDSTVQKWFKPATQQFQLYYKYGIQSERSYEPDFVVETKDRKYLVEVKAENEINDPEVQAKADAGKLFCEQASEHAKSVGSKPWAYILIPDTAVASNMSIEGLASRQ